MHSPGPSTVHWAIGHPHGVLTVLGMLTHTVSIDPYKPVELVQNGLCARSSELKCCRVKRPGRR